MSFVAKIAIHLHYFILILSLLPIQYIKLKRMLTEALNEYLRPLRQRRKALEQDLAYIREVLDAGVSQARFVGKQTLQEVRQVMNMEY
jgi:hypothetical protein